MKQQLQPASPKARALLQKLQALAERGIDGEKSSAQRKIARLNAKYDFTAPAPGETEDLFLGTFKTARTGRLIYSFKSNEFDVANSVKWAIESATKIPCLHRGHELLAEATPGTAKRLKEIAAHITGSFSALLERFSLVEGVSMNDRGVFIMGLYDGMMNEVRAVGQRLPSRAKLTKLPKGKKRDQTHSSGLHVHPYSVGLSLGRQIRFSVPLEQITAELETATRKGLAQETPSP